MLRSWLDLTSKYHPIRQLRSPYASISRLYALTSAGRVTNGVALFRMIANII